MGMEFCNSYYYYYNSTFGIRIIFSDNKFGKHLLSLHHPRFTRNYLLMLTFLLPSGSQNK